MKLISKKQQNYNNVKAATLKKFIEADDIAGDKMLKNDASLDDARNKMNDDAQKNLEELYAKKIKHRNSILF